MIDSHRQPIDHASCLRAWCLVALFVLLQLPLLLQPVGRTHKWRQADTAAVARNFALESANIFYPRVDVRQDLSGITGMEFPLYPYIVGLIYRFISVYQDWPAKLVALLAGLGVLWYGSQFIVEVFKVRRDLAITALSCNPVLFFYSTRVMPETTGLFLVIFGTLYYVRATQESQLTWTNFLLAFLGLGMGVLVRPYFIFWGLPILAHFLKVLYTEKRIDTWSVLLGFAVLLPFTLWYFVWSPYLVQEYGLDYFFTGSPFEDNVQLITTIKLWWILFKTLSEGYCGWVLIPFCILGVWRLLKRRTKITDVFIVVIVLALLPILTILVLILLTGSHFSPHAYYFFGTIPSISILVAVGLQYIGNNCLSNIKKGLIFLLCPLIAITHIHKFRAEKDYKAYESIMVNISQDTKIDELVVIEDIGSYAFSLHPIRRRGWVVGRDTIRNIAFISRAADKGARWALPLVDKSYKLYAITTWRQQLSDAR